MHRYQHMSSFIIGTKARAMTWLAG